MVDERLSTNPAPVLSRRHIAAVVAGNALEFYDFLVFSFFAIPIGRTFFPSQAPNASLLAALATFGVGYLTRPLGGIVIGLLANRAGRKPAMLLSFTLMGLSMLGLAGMTVGTYVLNTLTTYAINTLKMEPGVGFAATLMRGACGASFAMIGGALSDRFGRRLPMLVTTLGSGVLAVPLLMLVAVTRSPVMLQLASGILGALVAVAGTPILTVAIEALPARWRAGAMGIIYAFAISVFGGSTPFVVTWLTGVTHNPLMPGWYLTGASVVGLAALWFLPETAPIRKGI